METLDSEMVANEEYNGNSKTMKEFEYANTARLLEFCSDKTTHASGNYLS